jgi:hypothetical protein
MMEPIIVRWLVLPKGYSAGKLDVTVMPVIDASSFDAKFNWSSWIKESLSGFTVTIDSVPYEVDEVELRRKIMQIEDQLWDVFFDDCPPRAQSAEQFKAASAKRQVFRDTTSDFAKVTQEITTTLIALHFKQTNSSLAGYRPVMPGVRIDKLFPTKQSYAIHSHSGPPTWESDFHNRYEAVANIFLPVKPSLAQQRDAQIKHNSIKLTPGTENTSLSFRQKLEDAYVPRKSHDKAGFTNSSPEPVFTLEASNRFDDVLKELKLGGKDVSTSTAGDHSEKRRFKDWAKLAIGHMTTTMPYIPLDTSQTQNTSDHPQHSQQNRLAMLLAESGILSRLGLVFDFSIFPTTIKDQARISVCPKWAGPAACLDEHPKTVITASGFPAGRSNVYDERGFLKLGLVDKDEPQFFLTDFRFDEAFRQIQNSAQTARNLLPEFSPGSNAALLPVMEFSQINSHDLALHWRKRPDTACEQETPNVSDIYLDDLVIGIRPLLAHVGSNENLAWFDICAKSVTYGILQNKERLPDDIARDDSYIPLVTFDRRHEDVWSVAEMMFTWNGWGLGLKLPGECRKKSRLDKNETIKHKSCFLPFRYGTSVGMAARLVLRDGSCLLPAKHVSNYLGTSWAMAVKSERVVGAHSRGKIVPFRLLRWERLSAPLILHDGKVTTSKWWPDESASRVVIASSLEDGVPSHLRSCRYIVPDKIADMYSTWKHGMFDNREPRTSAFESVEMDDCANFLQVPASSGEGKEAAYVKRFYRGSRRTPYHPDPLVTRIRIWAMRRHHEKSTEGILVSDVDMPATLTFDIYGHAKWPSARALRMEVKGVKRHGKRLPLLSMDASGHNLKVRIPEGEKMTLVFAPEGDIDVINEKHAFCGRRLSGILEEKFPDLKGVITNTDGDTGIDSIHMPFLSNLLLVDVEHTVDKPVVRPWLEVTKLTGTDKGDRLEDATVQKFEADIHFDPGSTGAIEIYASRVEPEGDLEKLVNSGKPSGKPGQFIPQPTLVETFTHREMEKVLVDFNQPTSPALREPVTMTSTFQHDLHDFKHHKIAYWARGLRTLSTKPEKIGEQPSTPSLAQGHQAAVADLALSMQPWVVHVLASRKPRPPLLRYVVPSFSFKTEKSKHQVRRIRTTILVLHMDGDWFDSGADEKLAVVLLSPREAKPNMKPDDFKTVREKYEHIASFWGADPIKQGEQSLARLPDFISPDNFSKDTPVKTYSLVDKARKSSTDLLLALFEPQFCAPEASWRVEIALRNPSSVSRPFVRFAFARYQEYALTPLRLSDIVVADYAQLSDEREAVILHDSADERLIHVTVYGISYEGTEDTGRAEVVCWLEQLCASQTRGEGTWVAESEPIYMSKTIREGRATWYAQLRPVESGSCARYRVSILEEERYKLDRDEKETGTIPIYFDLVPVSEIR